MSSKVAKLISAYRQHLTVPWQPGLAAIQRVIFAVYDKTDELRLRANVEEFALATQQAGKQWLLLDVTNAFPEWMAAQEYRDAYFECPEDLAGYQNGELTEFIAALNDKLKTHIKTIGLFNTKAKNVIALSEKLIYEYDGKIPNTRDELVKLPGVGRKTANVVLNVAFGQPTMAVDTHIFRVSNRTSLAPGKTPEAVEEKLLKVVPTEFAMHAHHWLILHGRYICKARTPLCAECPVYDQCAYKAKTA